MVIKKNDFFFGGGSGRAGAGGVGWGCQGQDGCERRSKVFVKIQKKMRGGLGRGWGGSWGSDQELGWGRWG